MAPGGAPPTGRSHRSHTTSSDRLFPALGSGHYGPDTGEIVMSGSSIAIRATALAACALALSGCLVMGAAGTAIGVAGSAVSATAKGAGKVAGAIIPGE
jgi:Na+-driven multidrug efflux pump